MKKVWLFLVCALLIFGLCACASTQEPYTVEKNRLTFQIDPEAKTISDGTDTYSYSLSGTSSGYRLTITFPNGSTYSESSSDGIVTISTSKDYKYDTYPDGGTLCAVLEDEISGIRSSHSPIGGILTFLLGLLCLLAPRFIWYVGWGWRFKDAQPSDLALILNRICGAVFIIIGILMVFVI